MFVLHSVRMSFVYSTQVIEIISTKLLCSSFPAFFWVHFIPLRQNYPFSCNDFPVHYIFPSGKEFVSFLKLYVGICPIHFVSENEDERFSLSPPHRCIDDVTVLLIKMIGAVKDSDYMRFCLLEGCEAPCDEWADFLSLCVCNCEGERVVSRSG